MQVITSKIIDNKAVQLIGNIYNLEFYSTVGDPEEVYVVRDKTVLGKIILEASQAESSWAEIVHIEEL
jgi:hypothetical protein